MERDGTGWTATGVKARPAPIALGCRQPRVHCKVITSWGRVIMFDQPALSQSGDDPVVLRASAGASWAFAVFAAVFAFALARGYVGAATTAGRIGVIAIMGVGIVFCGWAALYMAFRRPTLSISASAITYAKAASARTRAIGGQALVLDRSSGTDLRVVTATRRGRAFIAGLTIPGSGTTLPVASFGVSRVRKACIAKGWRFPAGPGAALGSMPGPGVPGSGSGDGQGSAAGRSAVPAARRPAGRLSGVRISCGIIWAVMTVILGAGGAGEVTIGNAGGAILCFVVAAGTAWYDVRVWTSRARLLVLIIGIVSERPQATRPGR
jgi:hypothetical protein